MTKIRTGLVLGALATVFCAGAAFASGGTVKLKTDNGPDGFYYNALGAAAGRYCSYYTPGEFDIDAVICGVRHLALDQSTVTVGVDAYTLTIDLRKEDPAFPTFADLTGLLPNVGGLIVNADANSIATCSTTANFFLTSTYGGGAGIPDPLTSFVITMPQPANNDPNAGIDFCGLLLDTSSVITGSARTQGYAPGGATNNVNANHFLEAIVFEPKEFDLAIRMTGSSRFAGDRGLPVQFGRRNCSGTSCKTDGTDMTTNNKSDDFISARLSIDNNSAAAPRSLSVIIVADRSVINPKLGPKDVTAFFKPIAGGMAPTTPIGFPNGRTLLKLEIKIAIKRKFLSFFPVNLPFSVRLEDPNDSNDVPDSETQALGLRANAGYYDDDSHDGGFFFSQSPVVTGDALITRFDAVDLPKINNTLNVTGAQFSAGEFGASGLAGLDAFQLRREDAVLSKNPDLSPQGLFRSVGTVGDMGNADGIPTGAPVTTVSVDFTNYVVTPTNDALALNLFCLAYLNPGDTGASATAVGSAGSGDTFIGNSSTLFASTLPVSNFTQDDLNIRLDVEGELGTSATGPRTKVIHSVLREQGRVIYLEEGQID